ncbi:VanZ family protein [Blastococcus litoris]|uniref:VanZ family protein n=1 Tax=Blastococcus litoris TaxID=2171622 RepID=UPI001F1336F7|nr:VanZ family protein [Blastococcus litoris]
MEPAGQCSLMPARRALSGGLVLAGAVVALLTLLPTGSGWTWGAPSSELHWYATGWGSPTAMLQLFGNLALLAPLATLAVLRWPRLATPGRLAAVALPVAASIELLQWALPLGRVVSPLDALLNAAGAVLTGLLVRAARSGRRPVPRRRSPAPAPPPPRPHPAR